MKKKIKNFCGGPAIEVSITEMDGSSNTVCISQYLGSCSFCHHMTPAQAREMAAALVAAADELKVGEQIFEVTA